MTTRSYCSSRTCSMILQSMHLSKEESTRCRESKHSLELYNPTPEQSKCCWWTPRCATHTPAPSLSKRCERSAEFLGGEGEAAATSWSGGGGGGQPNTHQQKARGVTILSRKWDRWQQREEVRSSQTKAGDLGETKEWTDVEMILEVPRGVQSGFPC